MADFVRCGMYYEDGIAVPIYCNRDLGDCVIETAIRGNLLIDNLVVDDAEPASDTALAATIKHFKGIGAIISTSHYIILRENSAEIWDRLKPAKEPLFVVDVNYDIEYEGEIL